MRLSIEKSQPQKITGLVIGLLIFNGFLIAIMLAFAKMATSQGIPAITYAFWQTLIAGSLLFIFSLGEPVKPKRGLMVYFIVSALTGVAIPNAIAFMLVTQAGAGFTGIMYALPPIFTFALATLMGYEAFRWVKASGLLLALLACIWIVLQRHAQLGVLNPFWYVLGMAIPVFLSIGNVYRSVAWPKGIKSRPLAAGTLLASALFLSVYAQCTKTSLWPSSVSSETWLIMVLQGALTALTYLVSFELQRRSNPVFYSQLGMVAALFGLFIGVFWFGERYAISIWFGVLLVIAGLRLSHLSLSFPVKRYVKS